MLNDIKEQVQALVLPGGIRGGRDETNVDTGGNRPSQSEDINIGEQILRGLPHVIERTIDGQLPNDDDEDGSDELDRYQADHIPSLGIEATRLYHNPQGWWRENGSRFPRLAILARQYLAMPATSVPSEQLFSDAGNIVSVKRGRLADHVVSQLVFSRKAMSFLANLKKE